MTNQQPQTQIMRIDARNTRHQIWGSRDFERVGEQITELHEAGVNIALVGPETDFEPWQAVLASDSLEPISFASGKRGRLGPWTDELEAIRHQFKARGMVYAQREKKKTARHNTMAGHLAARIAQSGYFVGRTSLSFLFETNGFQNFDYNGLGINMRSYDFLDRYERSILSGARIALEGGASANCANRHNPDIAATFAWQRVHHRDGSFYNAVYVSRKLGN